MTNNGPYFHGAHRTEIRYDSIDCTFYYKYNMGYSHAVLSSRKVLTFYNSFKNFLLCFKEQQVLK